MEVFLVRLAPPVSSSSLSVSLCPLSMPISSLPFSIKCINPLSKSMARLSFNLSVVTRREAYIEIKDGGGESDSDSDDEEKLLVDNLLLDPILQQKLEHKMRMKVSKKVRIRRKKLVRKRRMRKTGHWPPSKAVNKFKNI